MQRCRPQWPGNCAGECAELLRIKSECLIIHDELDPVIPYSDAQEIHKAFKNSQIFTTQGLGHGLKSKQVIDKIIDFIQG